MNDDTFSIIIILASGASKYKLASFGSRRMILSQPKEGELIARSPGDHCLERLFGHGLSPVHFGHGRSGVGHGMHAVLYILGTRCHP